jgi:hypothetical protein
MIHEKLNKCSLSNAKKLSFLNNYFYFYLFFEEKRIWYMTTWQFGHTHTNMLALTYTTTGGFLMVGPLSIIWPQLLWSEDSLKTIHVQYVIIIIVYFRGKYKTFVTLYIYIIWEKSLWSLCNQLKWR